MEPIRTYRPSNPYPMRPGFGLRVHRAELALRRLGINPSLDIYRRSLDDCFEMGDGDAVVFALMHKAYTEPDSKGRSDLSQGIKRAFRRELSMDGFPVRWEQVAWPQFQPTLFEVVQTSEKC